MGVDIIIHLSNRFDCPLGELAAFFRADPSRVVKAERMIQCLRERGVGFACHDDCESPFVVYAGLLPFDSPTTHPLLLTRLTGNHRPVVDGN